jgi:hypothetical protein
MLVDWITTKPGFEIIVITYVVGTVVTSAAGTIYGLTHVDGTYTVV